MSNAALIAPLLIALTSLPVLVVAAYVRRGHLHLINGLDATRVADPAALARRVSLLLVGVGLAMLAAAAGLYWAAGDERRGLMVVVAMVVAVNVLGIALIVTVARARSGYREPPRRP
jgi:hypothetical protein